MMAGNAESDRDPNEPARTFVEEIEHAGECVWCNARDDKPAEYFADEPALRGLAAPGARRS